MIRLIFAGMLILAGLFMLFSAAVGMVRFSHMLNRVHAAAKCDMFGAVLVILGLMVLCGWSVLSLKLGVVAVFMWLCMPVAGHLAARAEVETNEELGAACDFVDRTEGGNTD